MPTQIETKLVEINSSRISKIGSLNGTENVCADGVGHYQHYQTGESIYWHPDTGAHLIYGLIKGKWANLGWEKSVLGYPNTDEADAESSLGRFNNFQRGTISWKNGASEAFIVYGPILDKWALQGWDSGALGFPLNDEQIEISPAGIIKKQTFEGGQITDPLNEGDFVQEALSGRIYKIENSQRRWIPDPPTLTSMTTWDKVILISDYELEGIPIGAPIPAIGNSDIYTLKPKISVALDDGNKMNVELVLNPAGTASGIKKVTTETLPNESQEGWTTEVKKVYLTADSTTFMNASNSNTIGIVPGAIYSFEDFIGGASNEILGGRNAIRIYTDNPVMPGSTGGIEVTNPSSYEILQGNGGANLNVIKRSIVENHAGRRFLYRSFTSNSEAELTLKVTGGGSYAGFTASGGYTLTQYKQRLYFTIDAVMLMYTIRAEKPINGFFSAFNNIPNKIYVKEVTYGTRILANVEVVLENREDIINFKAEYSGTFKANLGADFTNKTKNKNEKVNAYLVGAPDKVKIFDKDKLEEQINDLLATCGSQDAMPISYTLGDMNGNTVGTHSATDEIIERSSVPDNLVYHLDEARIEVQTGNDNKEWQSALIVTLLNANGQILMWQPVINIEFPVNHPSEVGLTKHPATDDRNLSLDNIKAAGGLEIRLGYGANIPSDAWRIEGVNFYLKFIDQNGIPYPVSNGSAPLDGTRPITCVNAVQTLDGFDRRMMKCFINSNFSPTNSTVGN